MYDEHDKVDHGHNTKDTTAGKDITNPCKGFSAEIQTVNTQSSKEEIQQQCRRKIFVSCSVESFVAR